MNGPTSGRDNLGPPPPVFRVRTRPPRHIRWLVPVIAAIAAFIALYVVLDVLRSIYTNLLWFDSVGYGSVYKTRIKTRVWLFFAGVGAFLLIFVANILLARRLAPATDDPEFELSPEFREFADQISTWNVARFITPAAAVVTGLIAIAFGASAASHWDRILLFQHAQSFGVEDPQFHHDLGFYVFKLPVYRFIVDWLTAALIVTIVGVAAVYVVRALFYGFRIEGPRPIARELLRLDVPRPIKLHVAGLVAALLVVFAARYYLDTFDLVYSARGVDTGAFYTDVHVNLPVLYALMAVAVGVGLLLILSAFRRGVGWLIAGIGVWIAVAFIGTQILPLVVQKLVVEPNEITKEEQYLQRNIDMTRYAYGLGDINEQQFPATTAATKDEIQSSEATINNVRLWDPETLRTALQQLQTIRPLFQFLDVDVDRYLLDGVYRQVMLSARELNSNRLPADAQTWVNGRLQFTHGYGYTVASVTETEPDGSPSFLVDNIPLEGQPATGQPELYFGEQADHYIIVDTKDPEFTPLSGDQNVETRFQGSGGVGVGGLFRRLVYSWEMGDLNILISGALQGNSRIIYRRNVQERIHTIAPFLRLDGDPYLVVDDGGMYWIQDAYTTTDAIPYSHEIDGVNYIRNSVKVVVNGYSGETDLYAAEPDEPLLKAYAAIFPALFKPLDRMPAQLQDHIRYPEDMFRLQAEAYLRYHIRDARQFYQREDQWDIPTAILGTTEQRVEPYYVIARLPGSDLDQFMLILPFVPRNRTNAIAWLAAGSDGGNYGKLLAFRFPSSESVPGPTQVERRIDSDARVSQQLTLWNQSGSEVIRGNLLMIPIGNSNMFFEPLYLTAAGGPNPIPQLKRVVVVNGDDVVMEPTLARAIDVLLGRAPPSGLDSSGATPASPTPSASPAGSPTPQATGAPIAGDAAALVAQAQQSYDRAQELLRNGDFAGYGQEIARLKQILDQLQQLTGTPTASP